MEIRQQTATSTAIDDRELEQLAVEPSRPLFPLLREAEAMVPLVVVVAFLPALYAAVHSSLTEQGALQGLAGLRALSAAEISDVALPAGFERLDQLRFQPPLMSWLTAVCMKLFGNGSAAGLLTAACLCTAGLLVAAYSLGRRLGGERLGLVTVLLLAFHPLILEGARQPVPQSAAGMFALLALAGVIAHWQKSSSMTSYQLLLGGVSLGLCVLAGGPVALAVGLIVTIYVVIWKIEARWRKSFGVVWDRSQFSRRTAFRSAAIFAATAFALAGWQVLLFHSRFGSDFWPRWLAPAGTDSSTMLSGAGPPSLASTVRELNRLALPVVGLALVGLGTVLRDAWQGHEDPARRHRMILVPWILVALFAWTSAGGLSYPDEPSVEMWRTFLAIPLIMAAALGLIEIAERRVGFVTALVAGLSTLADAAFVAGRSDESQFPVAGWHRAFLSAVFENPLFIAAIALLAGLALTRFAHGSEVRRRMVLSALLAFIMLTNCWWGAAAIGQASMSDRELVNLQTGLSRLSRVDGMTFVAPPRSVQLQHAEQPPARLVYGLASLWPNAPFRFASSWEEAVSQATPDDAAQSAGAIVFVAWSPRGLTRGPAPDPSLKPAAPSFLFQGLDVMVYVREPGNAATVANSGEPKNTDSQ